MSMTIMAREEAAKLVYKIRMDIFKHLDTKELIAFDMAIEALSKPKTGKWIEVEKNEYEGFSIVNMRCNQCGKYAYLVLPKGTKCVYDFCPNCGAQMKGANE